MLRNAKTVKEVCDLATKQLRKISKNNQQAADLQQARITELETSVTAAKENKQVYDDNVLAANNAITNFENLFGLND